MLRTIHPKILSLAKNCRVKQNTKNFMVQVNRTLTTEPAVTSQNEVRPNVKAIIDAAEHCGISSSSIETVLDASPHLINYSPKRWSCVLKILLDFGFIVDDVLNMLSECPEIFQMKEEKLVDNLKVWYDCQFGEDLLLTLLSTHPQLLTVEKINILKRVTMLTPYFEGRKRVGKALGLAPSIFFENWDSLFKKLEYLNSLHIDPSDIASTGVLRFDLKFIKMRHEFLKRAGLYKMPTKNYKKSLDKNKKLNGIINSTDEIFASNIAGLSMIEYEVFRDMYDVESEQVDEEINSETDSDDE